MAAIYTDGDYFRQTGRNQGRESSYGTVESVRSSGGSSNCLPDSDLVIKFGQIQQVHRVDAHMLERMLLRTELWSLGSFSGSGLRTDGAAY